MICCLAVHRKTRDVYGRKIWVMSTQTRKHLIQLLERSSSKHCPDYCVFAELTGMNSGDCYMKKRENCLPYSACFYTEIKLLAFFHWLNNFISKIFSLLISSLVNTYDTIPLTMCFLC